MGPAPYRIPFLAGNQTPRDHTQLQFSDAFPGEDPHLSLATILALAWRVREFTFSGSLSGSAGQDLHLASSPSTTWHVDYTFGVTFSGTVLPLRNHLPAFSGPSVDELDVTFAYEGWARDASNVQPIGSGSWTEDSAGNPPSVGALHLSGNFSSGAAVLINAIGDYDSLSPSAPFIPAFSISNSSPGGIPIHWIMFDDPSGAEGLLTVDPVIASSFQVPITLIVTGGTVPPGSVQDSFSSSASCGFTMTATKFWQYKNSNGDPVYNDTTGAQLVDPFS